MWSVTSASGRWFARGWVLGNGGGVGPSVVFADHGVEPVLLVSPPGEAGSPFSLDRSERLADATPTFVLPCTQRVPGEEIFIIGFKPTTDEPTG